MPSEEEKRPGLKDLKNFVYYDKKLSPSKKRHPKAPYNGKSPKKSSRVEDIPEDWLYNNPYYEGGIYSSPNKYPGNYRKKRPRTKKTKPFTVEDFPDDLEKEDKYLQYKPDSHIIGTRDHDYDDDDSDHGYQNPNDSYLQKGYPTPGRSRRSSKERDPYTTADKFEVPRSMRPSTKSPTRTSRDRKRSKSPQTVEKKFSRYLYHPPSYFTQKGQKAR